MRPARNYKSHNQMTRAQLEKQIEIHAKEIGFLKSENLRFMALEDSVRTLTINNQKLKSEKEEYMNQIELLQNDLANVAEILDDFETLQLELAENKEQLETAVQMIHEKETQIADRDTQIEKMVEMCSELLEKVEKSDAKDGPGQNTGGQKVDGENRKLGGSLTFTGTKDFQKFTKELHHFKRTYSNTLIPKGSTGGPHKKNRTRQEIQSEVSRRSLVNFSSIKKSHGDRNGVSVDATQSFTLDRVRRLSF
eukprot:UN01983